MREIAIVCRMSSRRGIEAFHLLNEELPKRGIRIAEAHTVERRKDLKRTLARIVKSRAATIAVVGGDGTQAAAVGELAGTESTLAVVPGGTGNSFALSVGIKDLAGAIDVIVAGKEDRVDVGVANDHHFAGFATVGLLAEMADNAPRPLKKVFGPVAYGLAAVRDLLVAKPFKMKVKWEGGTLTLNTHQAIVANGRYFGWQAVTPSADVHSGKLAFFAVDGAKMSDALATSAALLRGEQTSLPGAHFFSAEKIEIRTKPRQLINVDGHDAGKTPAVFRVLPKALRILVP